MLQFHTVCCLPFRLPVVPFSLCNFISPSFQPSSCPSWVLLRPWMYRIRRHRQRRRREKKHIFVLSLFPITYPPLTQLFPLTLASVTSSFLHFSRTSSYFSFPSLSIPAASWPTVLTHRLMYCTWQWPCIAVLLYNVICNITLELSLKIRHGRRCTCMQTHFYCCTQTHRESGI